MVANNTDNTDHVTTCVDTMVTEAALAAAFIAQAVTFTTMGAGVGIREPAKYNKNKQD